MRMLTPAIGFFESSTTRPVSLPVVPAHASEASSVTDSSAVSRMAQVRVRGMDLVSFQKRRIPPWRSERSTAGTATPEQGGIRQQRGKIAVHYCPPAPLG